MALASGVLRLPNRALIDWDEGVFAEQARWLATHGHEGDPYNLQTPPLYQLLIAAGFSIAGTDDLVLFLLSLAASLITIFLIYALACAIDAPAAAVPAVLIFVTTEYFLFFSISGLSEAVFLLWFSGALLFCLHGLRDGSWRSLLLSGAFACAAIYTKYSGLTLLVIMPVMSLVHQRRIRLRFFVSCIAVPALAFVPFAVVYLRVLGVTGMSARHGLLIGFHHHWYLYYLLAFAPGAFLGLTLMVRRPSRAQSALLAGGIVYFACLGGYGSYFRLAYPLLAVLCPLTGVLVAHAGRFRYPVAIILALGSLTLSWPTVRYRNAFPEQTAAIVASASRTDNCSFLLSRVPPNVDFYAPGRAALPESHPATRFASRLPRWFAQRHIAAADRNELRGRGALLVLTAPFLSPVTLDTQALSVWGRLVWHGDLEDAPVYYKDPANPLRRIDQRYLLYVIDLTTLESPAIDSLWSWVFAPGVVLRLLN